MNMNWSVGMGKAAFLLTMILAGASADWAAAQPVNADTSNDVRLAVVFTGGYETNPADHGRPVVLAAGALGVSPEVFRGAFSRVKPAPADAAPDPAQVRLNKQALLETLAPYGITNERLDEVSDYYRYNRRRGEGWRHGRATAYATVHHGIVTGFVITDPGFGYSSPPKISVAGMPEVSATATLAFGADFARNGSLKEIKPGN